MSERPIPLEPDAIFTAQPENIEVWNFGEPQIYMDAVEAENKRLTTFCDEFVWCEEHPGEYQSEMTRLTAENTRLRDGLVKAKESLELVSRPNKIATP